MDKTMRPKFDKGRTMAVTKTDLPPDYVSPKPSTTKTDVMADLPPCIYLVTGNTSKDFLIDTNEYLTSVGKSPEANITLESNSLSPIQLMIVKLNKECMFLDRGKRDILEINGVKSRQGCRPLNDRVVIKLENDWLVYDSSKLTTDTVSLKKNQEDDNQPPQSELPGKISLQYKNRTFDSTKDCLLIGRHQICDIRLHTEAVADFTALVYWNKDGVFIDKMGNCRAAVCVNRKRVIEPTKLHEGDIIELGKDKITVQFEGDVDKRAHSMFKQIQEKPDLALTVLNNPEPLTRTLRPNNIMTLGRATTADIQINDPSVSRVHAKIMVREKFLTITDNESYNKVKVNMEEVAKSSVFAGDIIELGSAAILIHYNAVRF